MIIDIEKERAAGNIIESEDEKHNLILDEKLYLQPKFNYQWLMRPDVKIFKGADPFPPDHIRINPFE